MLQSVAERREEFRRASTRDLAGDAFSRALFSSPRDDDFYNPTTDAMMSQERTEKEKMLAGELYDPLDRQLCAERRRCRDLCKVFNDSREDQVALRKQLLDELVGQSTDAWIQPPFFCDYGTNITLGSKVFFNFNCVVLDVMAVTIGSNVLFGPGVQIYTATHPMEASIRRQWLEYAKPITIGSDVWVGGGAIICPGVTIGDRTVIGAGSVVTRDIPADVFAAGNPCRVIKGIAEG